LQVSKHDAVADLTRPVAGILLTLLSNLSQTFRMADLAEAMDPPSADTEQLSQYIALLDDGRSLPLVKSKSGGVSCGGSRASYAASFQVVLRGLLQHVISCSECNYILRRPSCPEIPEISKLSGNCPEFKNCPGILVIQYKCPDIDHQFFRKI